MADISELHLINPEVGAFMCQHIPAMVWQKTPTQMFPDFDRLKHIAGWPEDTMLEIVRVPSNRNWHLIVDEEAGLKSGVRRPSPNPMATVMWGNTILGKAFLWTGRIA
jgi:hypothetical protein